MPRVKATNEGTTHHQGERVSVDALVMARFGHDDARVREPDLDADHPRTVADARVGDNARMPAYTVTQDAVRHAKGLIDASKYVLRSRWHDVQHARGRRTRS